jgi:hypothetical protein
MVVLLVACTIVHGRRGLLATWGGSSNRQPDASIASAISPCILAIRCSRRRYRSDGKSWLVKGDNATLAYTSKTLFLGKRVGVGRDGVIELRNGIEDLLLRCVHAIA